VHLYDLFGDGEAKTGANCRACVDQRDGVNRDFILGFRLARTLNP